MNADWQYLPVRFDAKAHAVALTGRCAHSCSLLEVVREMQRELYHTKDGCPPRKRKGNYAMYGYICAFITQEATKLKQ